MTSLHDAVFTAMTENEVRALAELAEGRDVIELGAQYGGSTIALATSAKSVHSCDWHQGDEHAGYRDTLHEYFYNIASFRNIVSHIGRFEEILPKMRRHAFSMALIDGQHDSFSVTTDFGLVKPLLDPLAPGGAIVAFHDYGRFGVKEAVDSLFKKIELVDTLAIVRL